MTKARKTYPSAVSDEEWAFCAPYLPLMKEDAPQHEHSLRELYNGLRWFVRAGCPWRMLPNDFPPWYAVPQQTQRWLHASCFEMMAEDLRALLRLAAPRDRVTAAVILDSRTLQSTPESGGRGGYDGAKKRKGSKVHAAVDTLGHLLAVKVTAANEQDRAQVNNLAQAVQAVQAAMGANVQLAYVDQGYTGVQPAADTAKHGMQLAVVKHTEAKRGFVLLPRRWGWNGPLRGRRAFADWRAITNGSRPRWPVTTGSPSPYSCSTRSFPKMHDRL